MLGEDEMIERIVEKWQEQPDEYVVGILYPAYARRAVAKIRAAGFELIERNELERLRSRDA